MTEKLKATIKEEIAKLPNERQEAINAFDWANIAEQLGKKYSLTENQINNLQVETLLVLVSIENGDSFEQNIESEVGISKSEAKKIADEVFEKIFEPIQNRLEENIKKSLTGKNVTTEQNLNFILSGGDYTMFMNDPYDQPPIATSTTDKLLGASNILETKDRLIN